LGFQADGYQRLVLAGSLSGTRYLKNDVMRPSGTERAHQPYRLRFSSSPNLVQRTQLERSRLAQSSKGSFVFGLVLLAPLILIFRPCLACKQAP
jgi:hypothetical protein